jgi:hypothetical protein
MRSGIVTRILSLFFASILPVIATGWKLTHLTTSLFSTANRIMSPT